MIITLSPAKSLDYKTPVPPVTATSPRFGAETARLARAARKLKPADLAALMHISDKLALLNAERYAHFDDQPERPAIYAFNGDVYTGFEVESLNAEAVTFAQDHVRILSGLYGLLRPLDLMRPYRLEMGTGWAPGADSLYDFWGTKISRLIASDLADEGSGELLNLASQEYWRAIAPHPPKKTRIVTIDFKEMGPKGLRFNSFGAKRARGMMARWVCEHRIDRLDDLRGFDSDGYAFAAAGSTDATWRFIRA